MLRFQEGEAPAFDELVRRNTAKIHSLVYRFLGEPSQVEDLTQEVFLRIYRTAHRYEPKAKFSTWLYRITANLCFNVLRSRSKAHTVPLDVSPSSDEGNGYQRDVRDERTADVDEQLGREELRGQVSIAIDRLPENQKVAIILNKFEDKSYEDISHVLGCSTMAVKSLLSRARANLHEALSRKLKREVEQGK